MFTKKSKRFNHYTLYFALILINVLNVSVALAQVGPEKKEWEAKDKPGDGVAEVLLPDGTTPMACRVEVSLKGGPGCTKIMCKGEQVVMTQSPQSMRAAKEIALTRAKAHYTHFLKEEIQSTRVTELIDKAISNEGGENPGTVTSSGYISSATIKEQASALIKGFTVVEDGIEQSGGGSIAYVIGGVSCMTQRAADNSSAGNKRDNSTNSGAAPGKTRADSQQRRRAGNDQM